MPRRLFHLEFTAKNGSDSFTTHSYYGDLKALHIDNAEELDISLSTLEGEFSRKKKTLYSREDHYTKWIIRKSKSFNTKEIKARKEANDNYEY